MEYTVIDIYVDLNTLSTALIPAESRLTEEAIAENGNTTMTGNTTPCTTCNGELWDAKEGGLCTKCQDPKLDDQAWGGA